MKFPTGRISVRSEEGKIIVRRFMDRFLESGLLILAVALGIGAASSGIALLANTVSTSRELLDSPGYKELVVSTAGEADDMDVPVSLKAVQENAVLTSDDLTAGELTPAVTYSYVKNYSRIHFINEESVARDQQRMEQMASEMSPSGGALPGDMEAAPEGTTAVPGNAGTPPAPPGGEFVQYSSSDLAKASSQSNLIISEEEEASGYEVTPGFFDAWGTRAEEGSLFSIQDMTGNASIIVLGADLADSLLKEGEDRSTLLGRQLLTREGLITVIGIIEDDGDTNLFYKPYRSTGSGDFRRFFMNTQLRFAVDDPALLDETAVQLQNWFDSQFGEQQVVISNPRAEAQQLIDRNTGIALLIMFLSLSGLFIASVNVSNILMSRGMRMKKHVGILMALGSSRQRITLLFGAEALGITLAGAALGMLLSLPLGDYMEKSLDITGGTALYTLIGVLLSAALTLAFGLLPARQYSRIDPAMAMRSA